jgi:predicted PP-loop superfamily ATPase
MKRVLAFAVVACFSFTATGCGGPDALMKEFLVHLNSYAEMLEKNESREKQLATLERVKATMERIDKLKLTTEQKDALLKKYEAEFAKVKDRIQAAEKAAAMSGGTNLDSSTIFSGFTKPK